VRATYRPKQFRQGGSADFQSLVGTFLYEDTALIKSFTKIRSVFFQGYEKIPYLAVLKNPSKIPIEPEPNAYVFQNLVASIGYLYITAKYMFGKIFIKI